MLDVDAVAHAEDAVIDRALRDGLGDGDAHVDGRRSFGRGRLVQGGAQAVALREQRAGETRRRTLYRAD